MPPAAAGLRVRWPVETNIACAARRDGPPSLFTASTLVAHCFLLPSPVPTTFWPPVRASRSYYRPPLLRSLFRPRAAPLRRIMPPPASVRTLCCASLSDVFRSAQPIGPLSLSALSATRSAVRSAVRSTGCSINRLLRVATATHHRHHDAAPAARLLRCCCRPPLTDSCRSRGCRRTPRVPASRRVQHRWRSYRVSQKRDGRSSSPRRSDAQIGHATGAATGAAPHPPNPSSECPNPPNSAQRPKDPPPSATLRSLAAA